jgi:glycosyltransferase involved in cell wall biosynthesis
MKAGALISVVVICYNQEKYIEQCIRSILNQSTHYNFEIIASDDASEDDTIEILKRLSKEDDRLKAVRNGANIGPAKNFIKALKASKGELIAFCEGDDFWTDNKKLDKQATLLQQNPEISFVYGDFQTVDDQGNKLKERSLPVQPNAFTITDLLNTQGPTMHSMMVRRDIFPFRIPGDFFRVPNPDVFIMAWAIQSGEGHYTNDVQSAYRLHQGGIWSGLEQINKDLIRLSTFYCVLLSIKNRPEGLAKSVRAQLFHLLSTVKKRGKKAQYERCLRLLLLRDRILYFSLRTYHRIRS